MYTPPGAATPPHAPSSSWHLQRWSGAGDSGGGEKEEATAQECGVPPRLLVRHCCRRSPSRLASCCLPLVCARVIVPGTCSDDCRAHMPPSRPPALPPSCRTRAHASILKPVWSRSGLCGAEAGRYRASMWPPAASEPHIARQLRSCLRLLPHTNNTGAPACVASRLPPLRLSLQCHVPRCLLSRRHCPHPLSKSPYRLQALKGLVLALKVLVIALKGLVLALALSSPALLKPRPE